MDTAAAERIFAHCRGVVETSRALRAHSNELHARYSAAAAAVARACRRLGRPAPRFVPRPGFSGGAGALDGTRLVLVTADPDTRDLIGLLMTWCGAQMMAASPDDVLGFLVQFRPDLVLIDLPFERAGAFSLARQLRRERDRNGGRPRLVAMTKHLHDHPEADTVAAGFDAQIAEPIDPEAFERVLALIVRPAA